jgi:hypothetical protein
MVCGSSGDTAQAIFDNCPCAIGDEPPLQSDNFLFPSRSPNMRGDPVEMVTKRQSKKEFDNAKICCSAGIEYDEGLRLFRTDIASRGLVALVSSTGSSCELKKVVASGVIDDQGEQSK